MIRHTQHALDVLLEDKITWKSMHIDILYIEPCQFYSNEQN